MKIGIHHRAQDSVHGGCPECRHDRLLISNRDQSEFAQIQVFAELTRVHRQQNYEYGDRPVLDNARASSSGPLRFREQRREHNPLSGLLANEVFHFLGDRLHDLPAWTAFGVS